MWAFLVGLTLSRLSKAATISLSTLQTSHNSDQWQGLNHKSSRIVRFPEKPTYFVALSPFPICTSCYSLPMVMATSPEFHQTLNRHAKHFLLGDARWPTFETSVARSTLSADSPSFIPLKLYAFAQPFYPGCQDALPDISKEVGRTVMHTCAIHCASQHEEISAMLCSVPCLRLVAFSSVIFSSALFGLFCMLCSGPFSKPVPLRTDFNCFTVPLADYGDYRQLSERLSSLHFALGFRAGEVEPGRRGHKRVHSQNRGVE